jgi:hypothetical protein
MIPSFDKLPEADRTRLSASNDYNGKPVSQLYIETRAVLVGLLQRDEHRLFLPLRTMLSGTRDVPEKGRWDQRQWSKVPETAIKLLNSNVFVLPLLEGLCAYTNRTWSGATLCNALVVLAGMCAVLTVLGEAVEPCVAKPPAPEPKTPEPTEPKAPTPQHDVPQDTLPLPDGFDLDDQDDPTLEDAEAVDRMMAAKAEAEPTPQPETPHKPRRGRPKGSKNRRRGGKN